MSKSYLYDFAAISFAFAGILIGLYLPNMALNLEFIGGIFLLLLKVLIIPLVVTSIFLSIAKLQAKEIKSLGRWTISYYFLTSSFACITGMVIINLHSVSTGFKLNNLSAFDPSKLSEVSFHSLVTSFFSGNFFEALSDGNIVQIVVVTLFLALASLKVETKHRKTLVDVCEAVQEIMMVFIG